LPDVSEHHTDVPRVNWLGSRLSVQIGPIAHGGHCVARHDGRVIFVRHALPGERAVVEVTEDNSGSFCRADAVEILEAAPERVTAPCSYAHPGGCGGCDFQHVALEAQRTLKARVIAEQFRRLAGIEVAVDVQQLEPSGLGWRRRIRYAVAADGTLGLRMHRSHQVLPISGCPLGAPGVGDAAALSRRWPAQDEVEVSVDDAGAVATVAYRAAPEGLRAGRRGGGRQRGKGRSRPVLVEASTEGPGSLRYSVAGRSFEVKSGGFWQTHPAAAPVFVEAVLAGVQPRAGDRVLDLYAGAGLFTAVLADAVSGRGRVLGLEADRAAVADAQRNLADTDWASVQAAGVTAESVAAAADALGGVEAVVLDPPRTGAGRAVIEAILALRPRVVCYVACDPAALARDVSTARQLGWEMADIRAFDAFPMTHHVECVATLRVATP
jgi:tRNA/tmRNA/rRNA uracil-C5-methylase (TrmA/RlmC/RlmD family)